MADKFQRDIENVDKSIGKLVNRIQKLKAELQSGNWGTEQITRMQASLDKLNTSLQRKTTRRESLVNQSELRDLEILNKQISTLQRNISIGKGSLGLFKTDDPQYQKLITQIKNAEKALASLESRRSKRFDPATGKRLTEQQIQQRNAPIETPSNDDVQRRINGAVLGMAITNAEVEARVAQARRVAKDLLAGRIGGAAVIPGGSSEQSQGLALGSNITYETKDARQAKQRAARAAELEAARLERANAKGENAARNAERTLEREQRAHERSARAAEEAAANEARIADARKLVANDPRYKNALLQAGQRGFGISDLQKIEDRGGGVQRLQFQQQRGGINAQFNPYVSQSGGSTPGLSSQFRSFGSDIARDIGQFTKWSIAVAAVYTPLAKLSELMELMVDNESRLADATIAANIPFERSGEIFDEVADAADRSGEAISGVIDAYAQAFRATGGAANEQERYLLTTQLLNDALILSKLSSLDQATAIDTLTAALLQSELRLDQGQELLNKWVRVSQIANVTIDGLAVGVAVLGDSAETAGLGVDKLNGLIAVLSEQSISGSKEAANTAKALIGAYQSDKAEAALNKYGIALRNANGEVREFLDVYQDVADIRRQGLITEAGVGELALALGGGGTRRAKDAAALINSLDRLNALSAESAAITGDSTLAQDSLEKKLQTVETATTRLSNAWQEFAQTLGDDGGLLDGLKTMINLMTSLTQAADGLFTLLGRSGPILATFVTGLLALNAISQGRKDVFIKNLGSAVQLPAGLSAGGDARILQQRGPGAFGRNLLGDVASLNRRGGYALGGVGIATAGIANLSAGRNEQAIGNVVGGVIGAAIGATLTGGLGIAIGANIGSAAGDSFVTGLLSHSQELQDYFAGVIQAPVAGGGTAPEAKEASTQELIQNTYKAIGSGNELIGSLNAFEEFLSSRFRAVAGTGGKGATGSYATPEAAALALLKEANPQLYADLQTRNQITNPPATTSPTSPQYIALQRQAEQERARQLERVSTGELKPAEFGRITERLAGFPTTALREMQAFGQVFIGLSKDVDNTADAYRAFLELTVNGTDEQQAQLNQYVVDIEKLQATWDNWTPGTKTLDLTTGTQSFKTKDELGRYLTQVQGQAAQFANAGITNARLQNLKLPPVVGSYTEPIVKQDEQKVIEEGLRIQQQYFEDVGASAEEIKHLVSNIEAFSVFTEEAGRSFFDTVEGLNQWAYDAAKKSLEELGKIASEQKGIGFQKFDIPFSQLQQLAGQSLSIGQSWQDKFNYDFKPEDQIAIDNQGIVQPLHADFKILALLLEKIVDQNQKQLDGQYNIPEGATFWVPLTAAYYRNQQQGGGADDFLKNLDLQGNTTATDRNTQALQEAAQAFRGDRGYSRQAEALKEQQLAFRGDTGQSRKAEEDRARYRQILGEKDYDPGLVGGRYAPRTEAAPTAQQTNFQSILESLKNLLTGIFTNAVNNNSRLLPTTGTTGGRSQANSFAGAAGGQTVNTTPTTKLDLRLSSSVNLMVDGRVLASTLQNYLASELLRTEVSQGTITKRYII